MAAVPLSPSAKDRHLAAQVDQLRIARRGRGDLDSAATESPKSDDDQVSLELVKDWLVQDPKECKSTCMCKLAAQALRDRRRAAEPGQKVRERAKAKEIVSHKFFGNQLFLLCLLNSKYARPEHLKLCQVDLSVRTAYRDYLEEHGAAKNIKQHWDLEKESGMFKGLYKTLDAGQARTQDEIRQCGNTAEWVSKTHNGQKALHLPPTDNGVVDRPPPAMITEHGKYWEVENIHGALIAKGSNKLWYLVKWKGFPHQENSWEPVEGLQMSNEHIQQFYAVYGRPAPNNPKILSPDGVKFVRWVEACKKEDEQGTKTKKKKR